MLVLTELRHVAVLDGAGAGAGAGAIAATARRIVF